MQDDVDQKAIAFVVNQGKFTGRMLERLALHYIGEAKKLEQDLKHPPLKHGKQSVKRLGKQGQGMTNIEITDKNIKSFERYAKKYGVDFAVKKDKSVVPPKYIVFFKAKDEESIKNAFKDFTKAMAKKAARPSVKERLKDAKDFVKTKVASMQLTKELKKILKKGGHTR